MDAKTTAAYTALLDELEVIRKRLKEISAAAYSDMEGADMPEFAISAELYCTYLVAERLDAIAQNCRSLMRRANRQKTDPFTHPKT